MALDRFRNTGFGAAATAASAAVMEVSAEHGDFARLRSAAKSSSSEGIRLHAEFLFYTLTMKKMRGYCPTKGARNKLFV